MPTKPHSSSGAAAGGSRRHAARADAETSERHGTPACGASCLDSAIVKRPQRGGWNLADERRDFAAAAKAASSSSRAKADEAGPRAAKFAIGLDGRERRE